VRFELALAERAMLRAIAVDAVREAMLYVLFESFLSLQKVVQKTDNLSQASQNQSQIRAGTRTARCLRSAGKALQEGGNSTYNRQT
jgi:hypothetical protein